MSFFYEQRSFVKSNKIETKFNLIDIYIFKKGFDKVGIKIRNPEKINESIYKISNI